MTYTIGWLFKTEISEYQHKLITLKYDMVMVPWCSNPVIRFSDMSYYDIKTHQSIEGEKDGH